MLFKFEELMLFDLKDISFGRIDGDKQLIIIGKEANNV